MSFPQRRDIFLVWPSSPSNGRRLEMGCGKAVLFVVTALMVLSSGEQLWLQKGTRGLAEVSRAKKENLTAPAHGPRRH